MKKNAIPIEAQLSSGPEIHVHLPSETKHVETVAEAVARLIACAPPLSGQQLHEIRIALAPTMRMAQAA